MTSNSFLVSLRWKREYKSDRERFELPYIYRLNGKERELRIEQRPFREEGFASTVWDSSILVSKFLERCPERIEGKRCLDLSAGCGLVAAVMSHLAPSTVIAADLPPNLPLLEINLKQNAGCVVQVLPHVWGSAVGEAFGDLDVIVACDVMYAPSHVPQLIHSLDQSMHASTVALVAYGRNAHGESAFLELCQQKFRIERIEWEQLDPLFRSEEISFLEMKKLGL